MGAKFTRLQCQNIGRQLERQAAAHGMTLAQLAQITQLDQRTIAKVLAGNSAQERSVVALCKALRVNVDDAVHANAGPQIAPAELGGYSRQNVGIYEGVYQVFRYKFTDPQVLLGMCFEIHWSDEDGHLVFVAHQRYASSSGEEVDFSQRGKVLRSYTTNLFHMLTVFNGSVRSVTVSPLIHSNRSMSGVVLTQFEDGAFYRPAISPIVFLKTDDPVEAAAEQCGFVDSADPRFPRASQLLRECSERFVAGWNARTAQGAAC